MSTQEISSDQNPNVVAREKVANLLADAIAGVRKYFTASRAQSLVITKLEEAQLWTIRCEVNPSQD